MINAKIIKDSINPLGIRLTTFELTYPRFIHAELMTHRALSKNSASSRAIPIKKMIRAVIDNPACPEFWGANERGMQAGTPLQGWKKSLSKFVWKQSRWLAVGTVWLLDRIGAHKQIANRILEPWSHITVICTGTYFNNFFSLRAHPMAQPEFQVLAYRMLNEYLTSQPEILEWNEWHLPYILAEDFEDPRVCRLACKINERGILDEQGIDKYAFVNYPLLSKVSSARCARVSYLTHDGKRDISEDMKLYERLVGQIPIHASALEHAAQAQELDYPDALHWYRNSNFHPSWNQFRKSHAQENVSEIDLQATLNTKPDWFDL